MEELNDCNRSLPKFCRKPEDGPAELVELENRPPTTVGPTAPVEPDNTFGAEILRLSIGAGSAGLMKRSLARRFCKDITNIMPFQNKY